MSTDLLPTLRRACLAEAGPETAAWPDDYREREAAGSLPSRLYQHCAPVARMVQAVAGGSIVSGMVDEIRHFWNRLPDGREIDLTSCQFGGDGFAPLRKGRVVRDAGVSPLPHLEFASRVVRRLR